NRELLQVILKRPESLTALSHLDGIGPAKVKRYGQEILEQLHGRAKPKPCVAQPDDKRETPPAGERDDPKPTVEVKA
ncbi:MAG: HRDC domain-containing protein, partial [Planctomycetota bacterium]